MKLGPLTFQCACLSCVCRSIASASRASSSSTSFVRLACGRSFFVGNMVTSCPLDAGAAILLRPLARRRRLLLVLRALLALRVGRRLLEQLGVDLDRHVLADEHAA